MDRPAPYSDDEVTIEMLEAGVEAADLLGFCWGWGEEENLVRRVYLAMNAVHRGSPLVPERTGET